MYNPLLRYITKYTLLEDFSHIAYFNIDKENRGCKLTEERNLGLADRK